MTQGAKGNTTQQRYPVLVDMLRAYWPVVGLWLLVLAFNWPLITPLESGRAYLVSGDFSHEFFPFHHFAASEWWQGRIPLWDPYVLGGHPYQADPQSAVFYPIGLLISFLSGPAGLTIQLLEWQLVLDQMLAAAFMYAFAHRLTGNNTASTIGAAAFTFSGYLTSYPPLSMPILETAIWLPLTLLFIERGTTRANRQWLEYLLAGLTFGIAILAGHPQTALYAAYFILAYFLFRAFAQRIPLRSIVTNGLIFLVSAFGLAAVQILPTIEFTRFATRGDALDVATAGHGYALWSLNGLLLSGFANEVALYAGATAVALIMLAWVNPKGRTVFWTIVAAVSVLLSLGGSTPVFSVVYSYIPGFTLFKDQERILLVFALAIGVLCALGYHNLSEASRKQRWPRFWLVFSLPVLLIILAGILAWIKAPSLSLQSDVWSGFIRFAICMIVTLGVVALWRFGKLTIKPFGIALTALICLELFMVNFGNNFSPENPLPSDRLVNAVRALQEYQEPYRIMGENQTLFPNSYGSMTKAAHIEGSTPMRVAHAFDLLKTPSHWRVWQLFNVRFVVAQKNMEGPFELRTTLDDVKIYHVLYTLPRIWAVTSVKVVPDNDDNLKATLSSELDPGLAVILEQSPALSLLSDQNPSLNIVSYFSNSQRIAVDTETAANAMLAFSEVDYPGWRAYVDRQEVQIFRADHALRAIELPAGKHHIEMRYLPLSFFVGLGLSIATLLLAAIAIWIGNKKNSATGITSNGTQ